MKEGKIIFVAIILILVRVPEVKAIWDNYESYSYQTWGGLSIVFNNEKKFIRGEEPIQGLYKWYYYKGHIIGKARQIFVLNEKTKSVTRFDDIDKWKEYLNRHNLEPLIWTRWYFDHIGDYDHSKELFLAFILIAVFCPPIALILIPLLIWGVFRLLKRVFIVEKIDFKRPGTLILSSLILFPLLRIFWIDWFVFSF